MITKDGRDTPIGNLTPENYIVPKGEEKSYHCVIEVVQYDPKTGKKLSKPRVQKFGKKQFETNVLASLKKQGYTVTILHDPNVWMKEQQEKAAERAKQQAEEKAKAEQERFDAAVAAAVAKQMAELQANNANQGGQDGEQKEQKKPGRPPKNNNDGEQKESAESGDGKEPEKE